MDGNKQNSNHKTIIQKTNIQKTNILRKGGVSWDENWGKMIKW